VNFYLGDGFLISIGEVSYNLKPNDSISDPTTGSGSGSSGAKSLSVGQIDFNNKN
jgi:hypothetical protein